jgi:hypothetical protein
MSYNNNIHFKAEVITEEGKKEPRSKRYESIIDRECHGRTQSKPS